jgi:hypothetical protein
VRRLEESFGDNGGCPLCRCLSVIRYHQEGLDREPILHDGPVLPYPCPHCGRPPELTEIVEVLIRTRADAARLMG